MSLTNTNPVTPPAPSGFTPTVLDEWAEVGNLTRNIVIQSPNDALWQTQGFGCHVMVMREGMEILPSGVYVLNCSKDQKNWVEKIIVE